MIRHAYVMGYGASVVWCISCGTLCKASNNTGFLLFSLHILSPPLSPSLLSALCTLNSPFFIPHRLPKDRRRRRRRPPCPPPLLHHSIYPSLPPPPPVLVSVSQPSKALASPPSPPPPSPRRPTPFDVAQRQNQRWLLGRSRRVSLRVLHKCL